MLNLKNKHVVEINYWDLNSQEGYLIITNTPKVKEAEKILDELREKVDNSKYHFGIKTYKDFTGEANEDVLHNDFVVYAKPLKQFE